MGWALLILWSYQGKSCQGRSCRAKKLGRWLALAFVLLTAVSTMVYGEHYLIDLLAAFFFSLIPWSAGAVGYLAWVVLVRDHPGLFWVSPVMPWASLLISCAVPLMIVFWRGGGPSAQESSHQ